MNKKYLILTSIILLFFVGCGKKTETNKSKVKNSSVTHLNTGSYIINNSKSQLNWLGKEITTKTHTGTLAIKNGKIEVKSNSIIHGTVQIDMNSINVTDIAGDGKSYLEGHLRSTDFFHVEKYSDAFITFQNENIPIENNQIHLTGNLTIKDITHPISFTANLLETEPTLKAKASLSFDRTKYDVRFRSGKYFENLGDKLILDDIDINVLLVTN